MCRSRDEVSVTFPESYYPFVGSQVAPYGGANADLFNLGQCCLGETDYDITKLVCKDPIYTHYGIRCKVTDLAFDWPDDSQGQQARENALAGLCCTGIVTAKRFTLHSGSTEEISFFCNPPPPHD